MKNLIKRSLAKDEIDLFYEEIKKTPNIIGYTKKEWGGFKEAYVAQVGSETVGVAVLKEISEDWTTFAILFVLEEYRGKGLGKELLKFVLEKADLSNRNVYMASANPFVINEMKKFGMTVVNSPLKLPIQIQLYNLRYILSSYRLYEFLRKSFSLKREEKFVYGYKMNKK